MGQSALESLLVVEEALNMALQQSSEIFTIPSQCTSLGTQIVLLKHVFSFSETFQGKCRFEFAFLFLRSCFMISHNEHCHKHTEPKK